MNNTPTKQGFLATAKELAMLLLVVFIVRTWGFGLYQVPTGSMETTMLVGERFFADKFSYIFRGPQQGEIISFNDPHFDYSENPVFNWYERYIGVIPFISWGPVNWTKRVIATPGQTVKGVVEDGRPAVYVDGKKLDEPYLNKLPLILVLKVDKDEFKKMSWEQQVGQYANHIATKSYDPNKPYEQQPYYDIKADRVLKAELKWPGTPLENQGAPVTRRVDGSYWGGTDEFEIKLQSDEYWAMGDNRLGSHDCRMFGPIKANLIHGRILFRIWSLDSDESWWIFDLLRHPIDFWHKIRWNRFFQVLN